MEKRLRCFDLPPTYLGHTITMVMIRLILSSDHRWVVSLISVHGGGSLLDVDDLHPAHHRPLVRTMREMSPCLYI